jgi:hypothetical protein
MRRFGYLFVGAIIAVIVGAVAFYYFVPTSPRRSSAPARRRHLGGAAPAGFPDQGDARDQVTAARISAATGFREALRSLQPPSGPDERPVFAPDRVENWVQRAGVILLLMFLVAIFSSLYRYSLRMAAFYDGRADALILDWLEQSSLSLAELAAIFGPEGIDFAKARSPAGHVVDLAKTALQAAGRGAKA